MNCAEWQERIALHAGGDATPGEASAVEGHVAECPGCQVFWSGMKETVATLRSLQGDIPEAPHFTAVRARVMGEIERSRAVWRRLAWISGVAAIVLLIAVLRPSERVVPSPPRMIAAIPGAPLVWAPTAQPHRLPRRSEPIKRREPLTVQLQTSDPNIVIYWIAD
jgi:hypothetical protein